MRQFTYNAVYKQSNQFLVVDKVNHYYAPCYYFLTKDNRFPNYNGQIAYITVILGPGAYVPGGDQTTDDDRFNFARGM